MKVAHVQLARIGSDRNFNSFLPAVYPFLKMVLCADDSVGATSIFCLWYKFCCESRTIQVLSKNVFHGVFFKFIRILKLKYLYLTCMQK